MYMGKTSVKVRRVVKMEVKLIIYKSDHCGKYMSAYFTIHCVFFKHLYTMFKMKHI